MSAAADLPGRAVASNLHASAVAFGPERAVLVTGPSGAGKSALAMALIERGAELVADDQVLLSRVGEGLYLRPPAATAGLIEARGIGLLRLPYRRLARARLVVALSAGHPPRLPERAETEIAGARLPLLAGPAGVFVNGAFAAALAAYIRGCGPAGREVSFRA